MLKRRVNGRQRIAQRVKPSLAVEQSQGEEKRVEERSEEEKSVKERRARVNIMFTIGASSQYKMNSISEVSVPLENYIIYSHHPTHHHKSLFNDAPLS